VKPNIPKYRKALNIFETPDDLPDARYTCVQGACSLENPSALRRGASSAEPTGNPPAALARSGLRCVSDILKC